MRTFIALPLPQVHIDQITKLQRQIETRHPGLYRWTTSENLHLTLYFLGDLEPEQLTQIQNRLTQLPPLQATLKLDSAIIRLPQPTVPKILALALTGDLPALNQYQQRLRDTVAPLAAHQETRPFLPHITIARLKKDVPPSAKPVKRLIADLPTPPGTTFTASSVHLYQSTLTPEGPIYAILATYPPTP